MKLACNHRGITDALKALAGDQAPVVASRNIGNIASPLQTSQSGFLRSLLEDTLAIRDLGNGPESSNYLDWIRDWWREHKLGTRHYVLHGIFLFKHDDVWAYDDAGGGRGRAHVAQHPRS
jgi:hypothetical protein